jgi:hypothetical protein
MPVNCPASLPLRAYCSLPVENIPLQAERHSARRQKLFAFPPESRSPSDRNAVRNRNGMVFAFRPESRSPSTGFPKPGKWASTQAVLHVLRSDCQQTISSARLLWVTHTPTVCVSCPRISRTDLALSLCDQSAIAMELGLVKSALDDEKSLQNYAPLRQSKTRGGGCARSSPVEASPALMPGRAGGSSIALYTNACAQVLISWPHRATASSKAAFPFGSRLSFKRRDFWSRISASCFHTCSGSELP